MKQVLNKESKMNKIKKWTEGKGMAWLIVGMASFCFLFGGFIALAYKGVISIPNTFDFVDYTVSIFAVGFALCALLVNIPQLTKKSK